MGKLRKVWEQRKHLMIAVVVALLFSLGGGGFKELRRIVLPFIITFAMFRYNKQSISRCFGFFAWSVVVLSLGYTPIMDGEQYLKLAVLSVLYSLAFKFLCTWQKYIKIALVFAIVIPIALYLNKHFGLDWAFFELICGGCYAYGYILLTKQ